MSEITQAVLSPSGKVQGHHRDRLAIVYVRQSTLQQLVRHQESTRLQYGLVDRALELGWPRTQVLVIDDDQGKSGTTAAGRLGFQRLVAEVGLNHVGLVLGVEMSRLARSCRDWHQLLEICGLFGTLIGDLDGVYDPTDYNDRLLLGLKGTLSEAELHVLKQRMMAGKRAKAARGELGMAVPMGYARRPSGEVMLDPDEQARATITLIFQQFERCGTINGVLQYLVRHQIQLPHRVRLGLRQGELDWRRPNRVTLSNLLHHPIYAGAYVYGRRPMDPRRQQPGRPATGRRVATPEEYAVLLKDRLPAYISWAQFERNQAQLAANQTTHLGPIRSGPSLLSGLVICGRCGLRMAAVYTHSGGQLRYTCSRMAMDYGEPRCQSLVGQVVDNWVSVQVLRALEPAALEISLHVAADLEGERQHRHQHWRQRLERTHYQVERAARQYQAVEPEHRLVARTLERQWEEALAAEAALQADYARFQAEQPAVLTAEERIAIRRLATEIPALWHAPTTTVADRQAIIRHLIERVLVTVRGESEQVDVQIHWLGGQGTQATLIRPVARLDQLSYYPQLAARVTALHAAGYGPTALAQQLNAEGWHPAKRCETFNAAMVSDLQIRLGLRAPSSVVVPQRGPHEWTLAELAHRLDMPQPTLFAWLRRGRLQGRQVAHAARLLWLIHADTQELKQLQAWRAAAHTQRHPNH
ncbi:MAG: recombinase family protein [Gammaproteobacteria bacterium]|nr:recombinase family protein [Gammaproteobacteria bacterium]MCP5419923.1 recombinase family protein [Gammaproteobacteria bacterium]MCP5420152.1 recombinase family protein [Gammaproteobacteria bacterium]MCP5424846.1 recombinase family protein [Gammaproteobacteria bacterium]